VETGKGNAGNGSLGISRLSGGSCFQRVGKVPGEAQDGRKRTIKEKGAIISVPIAQWTKVHSIQKNLNKKADCARRKIPALKERAKRHSHVVGSEALNISKETLLSIPNQSFKGGRGAQEGNQGRKSMKSWGKTITTGKRKMMRGRGKRLKGRDRVEEDEMAKDAC